MIRQSPWSKGKEAKAVKEVNDGRDGRRTGCLICDFFSPEGRGHASLVNCPSHFVTI
jgi:hypothetical protein